MFVKADSAAVCFYKERKKKSGDIMREKRCFGCMQPIGDVPICPHCGYDQGFLNEPHQLPAGTVLRQQYMVGKVLGQGGFGITYLGWDNLLNVPIAIKEYYPGGLVMRDTAHSLSVSNCEGSGGSQFVRNRSRFLREARSLAQLNRIPQVVQVHNFFEENNTAYIIMEYVQGITLNKYIRSQGGTLSLQQCFRVLQPVIRALDAVHGVNLIHRDISPDNIMLMDGGGAKLLDFGAVRDVGDADVEKPLTESTETILKQGYAPLEQYQKRGTMGPWTDVYAMTATIFFCLTGTRPCDAPGLLLEEQEIPWEKIPGLTPEQIQVLKDGTQILPKNRIRSMAELESRLQAALENGTGMGKPQGKQAAPPKKPGPEANRQPDGRKSGKTKTKTSGKRLIILAAVLLIGVAAAVLWFGKKKENLPDKTIQIQPSERMTDTQPPETEESTLPPETTEETQPRGVGITELNVRQVSPDVDVGTWMDSGGNEHTDALKYRVSNQQDPGKHAQIRYNLPADCKKLTCSISTGEEMDMEAQATFQVLQNGKVIYDHKFTRDTTDTFTVDISKSDEVTLRSSAIRGGLTVLILEGWVE